MQSLWSSRLEAVCLSSLPWTQKLISALAGALEALFVSQTASSRTENLAVLVLRPALGYRALQRAGLYCAYTSSPSNFLIEKCDEVYESEVWDEFFYPQLLASYGFNHRMSTQREPFLLSRGSEWTRWFCLRG